MKFIGFFELIDAEKAIEKFEKIQKMKKEDYEKAGIEPVKVLSPPYAFPDGNSGFQLFEADTLEPLLALSSIYFESMTFDFRPFEEASKAIEIQLKANRAIK
ncbi:MAG: DUF3303 family protein [Promethearchaeota archaeon]